MNTIQTYDTKLMYNSCISLGQYNLFALFRVLRPIRVKYKLSINDILVLLAGVIYHKHVSSIYSLTGLRDFLGYFNTKKFTYYHNRLIDSGYIIQSDIVNGTPRYKLTEKSINVISLIDQSYESYLLKFISDYNL